MELFNSSSHCLIHLLNVAVNNLHEVVLCCAMSCLTHLSWILSHGIKCSLSFFFKEKLQTNFFLLSRAFQLSFWFVKIDSITTPVSTVHLGVKVFPLIGWSEKVIRASSCGFTSVLTKIRFRLHWPTS